MIPVIATGSNVSGMVLYNDNKLKLKSEDKKAQFLGTRNISDESKAGIIKSIVDANSRNTNVKSPNLHISLSFPKEEILTNERMLAIADRYMSDMNYTDQPYAIYRHYDRPHPHIHIVSTQIGVDGKKISDSYLHYRSMTNARKIEKDFNLIPADRIKEKDINCSIKNPINESGLIEYLNASIDKILLQKPTNFKEFDKLLLERKFVRVIEKDGFYFKYIEDGHINNTMKPIVKCNELRENYNQAFLQYQFNIFLNEKNLHKKNIQGKIHAVLRGIDKPIPLQELKLLLLKKGVVLETKHRTTGDQKGLINGLFFKDTKNGIQYTASFLGIKTKDFVNTYILQNDHNLGEDKQKGEEKVNENFAAARFPLPEIDNSITDNINSVLYMLSKHSGSLDTPEQLLNKKRKRKRRKK